MNDAKMTQPILISGIVFGVATAFPPFSLLNICTCCSLFAATGFLAVYLLRKESSAALTTGQGALVGLGSGALGGVVNSAFSIPVALLLHNLLPFNKDLAEKILGNLGSDSSALASLLREILERESEAVSLFSAAWLVIFITRLMFTVCLFALFAMIGGILGVTILQKRQPPPVYVPPAPFREEPPVPPTPPAPPVDPVEPT